MSFNDTYSLHLGSLIRSWHVCVLGMVWDSTLSLLLCGDGEEGGGGSSNSWATARDASSILRMAWLLKIAYFSTTEYLVFSQTRLIGV